jgi:hypothetical protein
MSLYPFTIQCRRYTYCTAIPLLTAYLWLCTIIWLAFCSFVFWFRVCGCTHRSLIPRLRLISDLVTLHWPVLPSGRMPAIGFSTAAAVDQSLSTREEVSGPIKLELTTGIRDAYTKHASVFTLRNHGRIHTYTLLNLDWRAKIANTRSDWLLSNTPKSNEY